MVREFFGATSLLLQHFIRCEEKRKCFHILSRAYSFFSCTMPHAPIAEKDSNPELLNEGPLYSVLATKLYSPRPLDVLIFCTAAALFVVCLYTADFIECRQTQKGRFCIMPFFFTKKLEFSLSYGSELLICVIFNHHQVSTQASFLLSKSILFSIFYSNLCH